MSEIDLRARTLAVRQLEDMAYAAMLELERLRGELLMARLRLALGGHRP